VTLHLYIPDTDSSAKDDAVQDALMAFSNDELRRELARRDAAKEAAYWEERKREAKYLCHACGMPDSWHTNNCPADTSE
jgi:hypothetical protein